MKKLSKIMCVLLVVITLFSTTALVSSASTNYKLKTYYQSNKYTTVKLISYKKPAYVYVYNYDKVYGGSGRNYHYIKLTNSSGGWLWEGRIGSNASTRLYLGNDHKAYRIYVKAAYGSSGRASVSTAGNCRIY